MLEAEKTYKLFPIHTVFDSIINLEFINIKVGLGMVDHF